uniref:Uncharacterized protein n=1 Tax=Arundo donax TaxID=35708 RepID=A0A0A8XW59_ARUDO
MRERQVVELVVLLLLLPLLDLGALALLAFLPLARASGTLSNSSSSSSSLRGFRGSAELVAAASPPAIAASMRRGEDFGFSQLHGEGDERDPAEGQMRA